LVFPFLAAAAFPYNCSPSTIKRKEATRTTARGSDIWNGQRVEVEGGGDD
jgi:hypothetical protein